MDFSERLKTIRKIKGLTQKELAEKVGVERATIAGYETNRSNPNFEILIKISKVLNISSDYLIGKDDHQGTKSYRVPIIKNSSIGPQQTMEYVVIEDSIDNNKYFAVRSDLNLDGIHGKKIIIFKSDLKPKNGDLIIFDEEDSGKIARYYREKNKTVLVFEDKTIKILDLVKIIAVAVEVRTQLW